MIILKYTRPVIFKEYGFRKSSLTRALRNIYPLLQSKDFNYLQKRVEVGGISKGKVREIVKLIVQMKKAGQQTYLDEYDESLLVASYNIEGGHGLHLDFHSVSHQFKSIFKAVRYRCGDYDNK